MGYVEAQVDPGQTDESRWVTLHTGIALGRRRNRADEERWELRGRVCDLDGLGMVSEDRKHYWGLGLAGSI